MGFVRVVLSWAVLGIGLLVPTVAILEAIGITSLTRLELQRHGVTEAESDAALGGVWRFLALGLFGVAVFAFACYIVGTGRGNAALALGIPGIALWRWAVGRGEVRADRARKAARAAAAAAAAARTPEGVRS